MDYRALTTAVVEAGKDVQEPEQPQSPDDHLLQAARNCEGFDALEELECAIRHTRETRFGKTDHYVVPLSRQFLTEIRRYFPPDAEVFLASNKLKSKIENTVVFMRILTAGTFFAYAAVSLAVVQIFFKQPHLLTFPPPPIADALDHLIGNDSTASRTVSAILLLLGISALASGIRWLIRALVFLYIRTITTEFSHNLSSRYEEINKRIVECCLAAGKRGPAWHLRSKLYTIVATWNAKRSEYLDRYSTISAWKIRWFVTWAERISTLLKWATAASVSVWAALLASTSAIPGGVVFSSFAALFLMTTAIYFFLFFQRLPNDEWTRVLTGDISKSEEKGKHYFFSIGELVENLARTVLEVQRTPPSSSSMRSAAE